MGSFQRIGYRNDNNKVRKVGLRCCVVLILLRIFFLVLIFLLMACQVIEYCFVSINVAVRY